MVRFSLPYNTERLLYCSVLFLFSSIFLWSKHTVYNACFFQIVIQFVINVHFFSQYIKFHKSYRNFRVFSRHLKTNTQLCLFKNFIKCDKSCEMSISRFHLSVPLSIVLILLFIGQANLFPSFFIFELLWLLLSFS
jgi:hypothetical protein